MTLLGHGTELRIKQSPSPCGIYIKVQGSANYSWSPVFCFHKQSVTRTELSSFICILSLAAFTLQRQGWVAATQMDGP